MSRTQHILLDIEGTTSSIRFVYDEMFPYVRQHLQAYLQQHWPQLKSSQTWALLVDELALGHEPDRTEIESGVRALMDVDAKTTGLKELQGLIWRSGFESGQLVAHLYPDVAASWGRWRDWGIGISIYSSGSIEAQKMFFEHTVDGNLLPLVQSHFDTTIGGKKEPDSYRAIAIRLQRAPDAILFVSDLAEELDAAQVAGLQTMLCLRPGNKLVPNANRYHCIRSFDEIDLSVVGV